MSKRYDLIVFDWEGTIVDTLGALFNSVAQESIVMGLDLNPDKLRGFVELGLVNAVKKANTAHGKCIALVSVFLIYKCGNAANTFAPGAVQKPPGTFTMPEGFVLFGIEDLFHIFIEGADVVGVGLVEFNINPDKIFGGAGCSNFS